MTTQFPTSFLPDQPLIQDASYRFNDADRAKIDAQILGVQQVLANIITALGGSSLVGTLVTWHDGTDAAYTVPSASLAHNVTIPALTASHAWKLSNATAADGMRVTLDDSGYSGSTSGHYTQAAASSFTITVSGFNGTEHIYAEGKDQGTSYVVPAALLGNGRLAFEYRASDSTWHLT